MDFFIGIGVIILVFAIVYTPLFGLHYLIKSIGRASLRNPVATNISGIAPEVVDTFLIQKFPYYKSLDNVHRNRFLGRLQRFMKTKEFIPAGGAIVTKEMAILISASAIQVTFGLEDYLLLTFKRIFVYPKEFYSKVNKRYHKGETNLGGAIIFSWNNFTKGYSNTANNYNLGLHEMAHALRFNKFKNKQYDTFFDLYYEKWLIVASDEYIKLSNNVPSYLREYAGANKEEFFAVCVEHFFETPHEFKKHLPELYKHMCILLNQDPARPYSSYSREIILNQNHNNSSDNTEQLLYKTENRFGAIFLSKYSVIALLLVIGIILAQSETNSLVFTIVFGCALLTLFFVSFIVGKREFYIYSNRIAIISPLSNILPNNSTFYFESLVMVAFIETDSVNEIDLLKVHCIENGKIKSKSFYLMLPNNNIEQMATILVKKKVAVKTEGFKNKGVWY